MIVVVGVASEQQEREAYKNYVYARYCTMGINLLGIEIFGQLGRNFLLFVYGQSKLIKRQSPRHVLPRSAA